jgi:hypothetical protein
MWEIRGQFNTKAKEYDSGVLEWSSVLVDTQEEAEVWWNARTKSKTKGSVKTMYNPKGEVVRVEFS